MYVCLIMALHYRVFEEDDEEKEDDLNDDENIVPFVDFVLPLMIY